MRISDWSSDVCSSDLVVAVRASRPFPVDRGCADCPIRKMKIHREIRVSNDKFDLTGKVAIIVGGTQGMGLNIAEMFAASGARIMICSRTADRKSTRLNSSH